MRLPPFQVFMIQRMPPNCIVVRLQMKLLDPPEPLPSDEDRMDAAAARRALAENDRVSEEEAARELGLR